MNQIPVDAAMFDQCVLMVIGAEPVLDFETQAHKTDRDGLPKWKLQMLYKAPMARKPEVVEVGFAAAEVPELSPTSRPVFKGLVARHWDNENAYGYSSGVALSAEAVGFRDAPSASANGSHKEPVAA